MKLEQLERVTGIAAPFMRINIDTDQIAPTREHIRARSEGYGPGLFGEIRYRDPETREENPDFVLNKVPYRKAQILIADRNFGCGSSREGAPMHLRGFGFRAVVAPSFGGIFFNNCFRNGIAPVMLPEADVHTLARQVEEKGGHTQITVDVVASKLTGPDGKVYAFTLPAFGRRMLLEGIDEIEQTLTMTPEIDAYRQRDRAKRGWAWLG
ncbi:MAG: 3-isopropylmalate dehydratase small subunit [Hyphomicrobiaceae bacterium]|nr:3-isopropylmalate dehydratase small subunit [Hyphomicrobiaceae bacterium]